MSETRNLFITVDAETPVLSDGVEHITRIRHSLQQKSGCSIPITWFVRFQRRWRETVFAQCPADFELPLKHEFDGFRLIEPFLPELLQYGDEIGWHYHAYHYVKRPDLSHGQRIDNVRADLVHCAAAINERYPELILRSFRWGWLFCPDHSLQLALRDLGFDIDASILPGSAGRNVAGFKCSYQEPATTVPALVDGIRYFPVVDTILTHDYSVTEHDLGWSRLDQEQSRSNRERLRHDIAAMVAQTGVQSARLTTYQEAALNQREACPAT